VFNSRLLSQLKAHAGAAHLSGLSGSNITANPAQINHFPPAERIVFVNAFSHALQGVFLVAVPFAVLACLLSFLMKEIPLRTTAHTPSAHGGAEARDAGIEAGGELAAF
jgi:uncharacterized protein YejL (UPF0352 family)